MSKLLDSPAVLKAPSVDGPGKDYEVLARKLHIPVPKQPSEVVLQHVLSSLSIAVYNLSAVRSYLIEKRPKDHWVIWSRLTENTPSRALFVKFRNFDSPEYDRMTHGRISSVQYKKPVPYPVLLTIDAIVKEAKTYGVTPTFFVSDFAEKNVSPRPQLRLDPFLAVGTTDSDAFFVIERWDEPGFREEVYSQKRAKKAAVKK